MNEIVDYFEEYITDEELYVLEDVGCNTCFYKESNDDIKKWIEYFSLKSKQYEAIANTYPKTYDYEDCYWDDMMYSQGAEEIAKRLEKILIERLVIKKELRIIIVGSVDFNDYTLLKTSITKILKNTYLVNINKIKIILGTTKRTEQLIKRFAKQFNLEVIKLPNYIRNARTMIEYAVKEIILACW